MKYLVDQPPALVSDCDTAARTYALKRPSLSMKIGTESLMATMTVWKFDTATGAEDASKKLQELQKEQLITLYDAATVSWPESASKPKTR